MSPRAHALRPSLQCRETEVVRGGILYKGAVLEWGSSPGAAGKKTTTLSRFIQPFPFLRYCHIVRQPMGLSLKVLNASL